MTNKSPDLLKLNSNILVLLFSRHLAETSPYMEAMKEKDIEVLFLYEPYDELVLMNLGQFDKKDLKSIENQLVGDSAEENKVDAGGKLALECLLGYLFCVVFDIVLP